MTERQLVAIKRPISFPHESSEPLYHRDELIGGRLVSSILTVNRCLDFNEGRAVWHAAVAYVDSKKLIAVKLNKASDSTLRLLMSYAKELLVGVGEAPSAMECFDADIHYRRALTEKELVKLKAAENFAEWDLVPSKDRGRGTIMVEDV